MELEWWDYATAQWSGAEWVVQGGCPAAPPEASIGEMFDLLDAAGWEYDPDQPATGEALWFRRPL